MSHPQSSSTLGGYLRNALMMKALIRVGLLGLVLMFKASVPGAESMEIRVGSELDFQPYAFADKDGQAMGFSSDLIKAVAKAMGIRIRITTGTWDKVWNGLLNGEFDVLPTVARTPGREPLVDFSLPHTITFDAFFIREGRPMLLNLAAATGMEIVVLRSDAAHHQLMERKFNGKVIAVESIPEGLALVASGQHDAFLCSKLIGVMEQKRAGIKGLKSGPAIPDYKRVFSFAVRKGNDELREKLNQGLLIIKENGEYESIYRRWLRIEEPWQRWVPYFKWTVAGVLVLATMVIILQILVRRRTRQLARANAEIEAEVAERRKAQEELQELNANLEQRVVERARAVQESEARLKTLYSSMSEGLAIHEIVFADGKPADYRILDVNPAYETITGIPRKDAIGKLGTQIYASQSAPYLDVFARVAMTGKPETFEIYYAPMAKNFAISVFSPEKGRFATVFSDITERKKAEAVLARSKEELEVLIKERTAKLHELVQELEHFSYTITHDMRAPLRAMRGFAEIANEYCAEVPGKELKDCLQRICTGADRMDSLITDALQYNKAVRQELVLEPVDLNQLLRGMLDTYPEFDESKAHIRVERDLPQVMGNVAGLTQCFSNLLGNAIKFTKPGQIPEIRVWGEQQSGWVQIWVEDRGIGIPKDFQPHVFEMFSRGHRSHEGTGIGLALVRKVTQRMDGEVEVRSTEGLGSQFCLRLRPAA